MPTNPDRHHRRSIRLKGYDYTQPGAYFVTICTEDRECLLGEIVDGEMQLNDAGWMVQTVWDQLPDHYPGVDIDEFVVMPNHVHGIIVLVGDPVGATPRGCPDGQALPDVVHRFKSFTTALYRQGVAHNAWAPFPGRLWQRNYYEHIIRNERALERIRGYIQNNPIRWTSDRENPQRSGLDELEGWIYSSAPGKESGP